MTASVLYGLVLFSAAAHAIWNSLVKSAGDRTLTMVTIRFTGLVLGLAALPFVDWPQPESWKWLLLTALVQFGYYALLVRSYGLGDMSVVYPLARGIAPVLTTIAAFVSLGEALSLAHLVAVGMISLGIMVLSLGAGASRVAVGYACATGVAVAAYSLFGGLGVRTAGTVLGFQACLEIITGAGMLVYGLTIRGADVLAYARRHGAIGLFAGTMSVLGFLAFLAAANTLPLGPVVALRETSVLFGTLIGTLCSKRRSGSGALPLRPWSSPALRCWLCSADGYADDLQGQRDRDNRSQSRHRADPSRARFGTDRGTLQQAEPPG